MNDPDLERLVLLVHRVVVDGALAAAVRRADAARATLLAFREQGETDG